MRGASSQTVLERGYPLVFTGGGDGTFMGFVNEFLRQTGAARPVRRPARCPASAC